MLLMIVASFQRVSTYYSALLKYRVHGPSRKIVGSRYEKKETKEKILYIRIEGKWRWFELTVCYLD